MNFNALHKGLIALAVITNNPLTAEGQFEKFVTRRVPDQFAKCKISQDLVSSFATFVAAIKKQLTDFIDMNNNYHAKVHTDRIKNTLTLFKASIIQELEQLRAQIVEPAAQPPVDLLLKQLNKMHDDLNRIADILANHNGSTYLWDLQALGSKITGDATLKYLLPESYERLSTFQWRDILTKRYSPQAIAQEQI